MLGDQFNDIDTQPTCVWRNIQIIRGLLIILNRITFELLMYAFNLVESFWSHDTCRFYIHGIDTRSKYRDMPTA